MGVSPTKTRGGKLETAASQYSCRTEIRVWEGFASSNDASHCSKGSCILKEAKTEFPKLELESPTENISCSLSHLFSLVRQSIRNMKTERLLGRCSLPASTEWPRDLTLQFCAITVIPAWGISQPERCPVSTSESTNDADDHNRRPCRAMPPGQATAI